MPDGKRPKSIYRLGSNTALRTINWLLYGHPGVGKTPLWGTGEKVLLLDSDGGTESAEARGSRIEVIRVPGFGELSDVYQYLRYGKHDYKWVVWDGGTLFMDRVLIDEITADAAALSPKQSPDVASQREYLVLQNRMGDYVRRFVDLPINFGMSAHVMTWENPEGETEYIPFLPGGQGQFSNKMSGYFNLVTYLGIKPDGTTRRLLTERKDYFFSRDRFHAVRTPMKSGKKLGYLDNPTVPKVEELITKAREQRSGKNQGSGRQGRRRAGTVRR